MKVELITQSEFARRIKKTPMYIYNLVKRGKIILRKKKGKKYVNYKEGLSILKLMKSPLKDGQRNWAKEQKKNGPKKAALKRAAGIAGSGESDKTGGRKGDHDADPPSPGPDVSATSRKIYQAKLRAEENAAKIKELQYKKAVGELVPVQVVIEENAKIAEIVRTKLLMIPSRSAPRLMGMKSIPEYQAVLEKFINEILEEFHKLSEGKNGSKYTGNIEQEGS